MKILLTGAAGQLGCELRRSLACLGEVIALDRTQLDLTQPPLIREVMRSFAPTVIVNAGAYTAVDNAETNTAIAQAVNSLAPEILAEEAKRIDALLVHYSTDYVFDGQKTSPYTEDDMPSPLSVYGQSKLDGESAIKAVNGRHLILRTSWVFGLHGNNFLKTMLNLARQHDSLRIVGDQIGAPTWTRHLADVTAYLLARYGTDIPNGLYHLTAASSTNWHDYADTIFDEAHRRGIIDKIPTTHRITTADYPLPARRPANSQLDCTRFYQDFGFCIPDWKVGVIDCLTDINFARLRSK